MLALPLAALRLILNPDYTVSTDIEIPGESWPGRGAEAESVIRSPAVIAEGLAARSSSGSRQTPAEVLRRLILTRNEIDDHLGIWLQLRGGNPTDDRILLDDIVRAFARRYTRGRVYQNYPASVHKWRRYGGAEWIALVVSCVAALGGIFAILRYGIGPRKQEGGPEDAHTR